MIADIDPATADEQYIIVHRTGAVPTTRTKTRMDMELRLSERLDCLELNVALELAARVILTQYPAYDEVRFQGITFNLTRYLPERDTPNHET